jgi:hypothetical protein
MMQSSASNAEQCPRMFLTSGREDSRMQNSSYHSLFPREPQTTGADEKEQKV